nr:MAG TPA: hypothetical protein [Caudoviricetes sp.]
MVFNSIMLSCLENNKSMDLENPLRTKSLD